MAGNILPIKFPNFGETIYAGFWRRFGAFWLDVLIMVPIFFSLLYINNLGRLNAFYTYIPSLVIFFIYHIYFVRLWGATPGKLITKIKIIKKDGGVIGWREAILREIVQWVLSIGSATAFLLPLLSMSDAEFFSVGFIHRSSIIMELAPVWYKPMNWLNNM